MKNKRRKERNIYQLLFLFLFFIEISYSQYLETGSISGYVYDASNGESIIGANVFIKNVKMGCTTNTSGYFTINGVPSGECNINISYIGYNNKTQKIYVKKNERSSLKVYLQPESIREDEVVVTAEKQKIIEQLFEKPISKIELTPKQISKIPQVVEADLLRALQTLPGVVSISDFSSALYIRGGKPDQNLYLLDGSDIYNPEHAFGLFSTFNTDAIKKIDLSKGGFGAEYGGRLSSILNVTNLDGNRNRFEGMVGISLLSAKTTLQSPLGEYGSISGSFRRTYFDQTIAKWLKSENIPDYYFYDGNLKAFLDIGENDKMTISFFGGDDNLNFKFNKSDPESPQFSYNWGNTVSSLNWKHVFNSELFSSFIISYSRFISNFNFSETSLSEVNNIIDLTFKGNFEYYASEELNLRFGFEQKNFQTVFNEKYPNGIVDANKKPSQYVTYLTAVLRPSILWEIETGARFDYFNSDKKYYSADPRFSIKYRLSESMNLKFATGIYHQYLNRIERGFIAGIWTTADKYVTGSSSEHYIFGFQKEIANKYSLELETFYKSYRNIYSLNNLMMVDIVPDYYDNFGKPVYTELKNIFNRGDGLSKGIEMLLRKDVGSFTGWLGYTLTNTQYKIDGINNGNYFVPRHNRTSVINLVANLDMKDIVDLLYGNPSQKYKSKWLVGLNFVYSTGQPITIPGSVYNANTLPMGGGGGPYIYPAAIDEFRLPDYIRLDLSVSYEKSYDSWKLETFLQIFNIGNRKNVFFINYEHKVQDNMITQKIDTFSMIPILPSIGINIKF